MNSFMKILILMLAVLNTPAFAQTANTTQIASAMDTTPQDTIKIKTNVTSSAKESNTIDTTQCRYVMLYRNYFRYSLNKTYNKDAFNIKHNSFKGKKKEPWIADALKEIIFR